MGIRLLKYFFLLLLFFMLLGFGVSKYLNIFWYEKNIEIVKPITINIDRGYSLKQAMNQLEQEGLLEKPILVRVSLALFYSDFILKAGEYRFEGVFSRQSIFQSLHAGISKQYQFTIIEGQTIEEVFNGSRELSQFLGAEKSTADNQAVSKMSSKDIAMSLLSSEAKSMISELYNAEGWFFPDTYYYTKGDSLESLLLRSHRTMLQVLKEEWGSRQEGLPYENPYQALIMASLIEKETGAIEEREQIAGVFIRRLRSRMRLQTDPTVIYGMGDNYKGNLRRSDLKRDTPYNTYTRHGLPITPIALPGRGAIHAALNPASGSSLYFVAKGNGYHQFSDTLEQHRDAVQKYQVKSRRSDYRSSPVPKS